VREYRLEKNLYTDRQAILLGLLRSVRKDADLRQEDVAKILERPQSFVSKYESGERRLDILELYDVCKALGITLAEFTQRLESKIRKRTV
jgi:transcriptional regulator with XRE-family HTH domain